MNEVQKLQFLYEDLEEVANHNHSSVLPSFFIKFFSLPTCPLVDSILSCYKALLWNDYFQIITLFSGTQSIFVIKCINNQNILYFIVLLISITDCEDIERIKINHIEELLSKISARPASFILANEDFQPAADGYISIYNFFKILMKHQSYTAKLTQVQNCFEKFTFGNIKWQKIRHRRSYIRKAYEYSQKHNGKMLKESIGSKLKRLFSREPPLFKYDFHLPYEKVGKTELDIMKSYRQRYHPFVAVEKAEDRRLLALKRIGSVHSVEKPATRMDFLVDDDVFPINYENDNMNENINTNNTNDDNKRSNLVTQKSYKVMDNSLTSPPYNSFKRSETTKSEFRNVLLSPPGCIIMPNEIEFKSPLTSPHNRMNGSSPLCPKKSPIISLRKNPLCSDEDLCLTINPPPQLLLQQQNQQQLLHPQLSHGVLPYKRNISESLLSSSNVGYKDRSYSAAAAYQYSPVTADTIINTNSSSPIRIPLSPPRSPTNTDSFNHYRISGSNVEELEVSIGSNSNLSDILHATSSNNRISGKIDEEQQQLQQQQSPPPQLVQLIQISPIKPRCLSYSNGEQVASVCSTMRGRKITLSKYVEEDENKHDLNFRSTVYENEYEDEKDDDDIDYDKYINSDKPKYKLTKNKDK